MTMAWIANERSGVGPSAVTGGRVRTADAVGVFLARVYRLMALGLAVTGFVALLIASSPDALQFFLGNRGVFFGVIIAQLLVVMALSALVSRISAVTAGILFFGYAA